MYDTFGELIVNHLGEDTQQEVRGDGGLPHMSKTWGVQMCYEQTVRQRRDRAAA